MEDILVTIFCVCDILGIVLMKVVAQQFGLICTSFFAMMQMRTLFSDLDAKIEYNSVIQGLGKYKVFLRENEKSGLCLGLECVFRIPKVNR